MQLKLIINPRAGNGNGRKLLPKILSCLKGHDISAYFTKRHGDAIHAARAAAGKYDLVIAVGGDGTINQVMSALVNTPTPLGVIPIGTTNVFAREFRIPRDIAKSCRIITQMHMRRFDVGAANHHYFLMWAGIGLDASVLHETPQLLKQILGIGAYPLAALKKLIAYRSRPMRVHVNGRSYTSYFTIISNIRNYGGFLQFSPEADPHDGLLDVCMFPNKLQFFGVLKSVVELKAGIRRLHTLKATHIRITAPTGILIHTDAEILGTTPLTISVLPQALSVIVP
ncbi:diacylglycerol kinase family lipid kinase [Candidatus Woesearchaeota archaeon]|nr:diacylglycerol kinase family lipid kinase [Candidatus Woesearchaeota archaeon]